MSLFAQLTARWVPPTGDEKKYRVRVGIFQGWLSVIVNSVLFLIKLLLGLLSGSLSLVADAVHSLSDVVTSAVVIWGFRVVDKPADTEHPYGHGRAEYVATLVIAILLAVVGIEFVKAGIQRILQPQVLSSNWWMVAAVAATIVVKEWIARYAVFLSGLIASDTLRADAWHHRTDAISSVLVVIAMIAGRYGWYGLDGYAGVGVAAIILWTAVGVARGAIDDLLGKPPSDAELDAIRRAAVDVPGVLGTHDISVHSYGSDKYASLHIEVDANLTTLQTHDIAESVEESVLHLTGIEPTVHADPVYTDHPLVSAVRDWLQMELAAEPSVAGFHDIRIVDTPERNVLLFGINFQPGTPPRAQTLCCQKLKERLQQAYPGYRTIIKISPLHTYA